MLSICPFDYVMEEPKIFGKPTGRPWFSFHGKDLPCSLFTGQREKGFFGSLREYRKQDTEGRGEFLRSLYENAALTEQSRIKVENMRADVLLIAPERDNEWPSPDAVRRMEKRLRDMDYPHRAIPAPATCSAPIRPSRGKRPSPPRRSGLRNVTKRERTALPKSSGSSGNGNERRGRG